MDPENEKGGLGRPFHFQTIFSYFSYNIFMLSTWMDSPVMVPVTAT